MTEQDLTFEMMFSEVRNSLYISPLLPTTTTEHIFGLVDSDTEIFSPSYASISISVPFTPTNVGWTPVTSSGCLTPFLLIFPLKISDCPHCRPGETGEAASDAVHWFTV